MFIKNKTKKYKGSVLVFSMILLSIILTSALAIGAAAVIERKNSLASNKSTQGFQVADTGVEMVAKKIREAAATQTIIGLWPGCSDAGGAHVTDSTIGTANIYFFKDTAATTADLCADTVDKIQSVRSVGTYSTTTRAVQASVRNHQAAVLLDSVPVSYWKMDESIWNGTNNEVKDATANLIHGTAKNGVTTTNTAGNYKFGTYGGGSFNGTNQYISIPDNPLLKPTSAVTVEAWINLTASPAANTRIIAKSPYISANNGYQYMLMFSASGSVFFDVSTPAGERTSAQSAVLNTNMWYYVAGVYDGTNVKVYLNGVESSTNWGSSSNMNTPAGALSIGNDPNLSNYFQGYIDEVAIYSRALSQVEIQSHR